MDFKISFHKSIRFKLAAVYSLLVFVFCSLFLLVGNILITSYYLDPPKTPVRSGNNPLAAIKFNELQEEERERINDIREDDLESLRTLSLLSLVPLAGFSFAAGYVLSGVIISPLGRLNQAVKSMDHENLKQKFYFHKEDDEIGELIESFNTMMERLDKAFESQVQFVQDASHEIKTPLAIIQTNIDTLLQDDAATEQELKKAMQHALTGVGQMNRLVEDLLSLSLPENGYDEEFDLVQVLDDQIDALKPLAKDRKVELLKDFKIEKAKLTGNSMNFSRAIYNILENAIKYSAEVKNSKVIVSVSKKSGSVLLKVEDNGIGIPKNALPYIFDRFYRVDKSRSRTQGGFGLGLSLAKKIITQHRGSIEVKSKPGKTVFQIALQQAS